MEVTAEQYMLLVDNEDGTSTLTARVKDEGRLLDVTMIVQSSLLLLVQGLATPEMLDEGAKKLDEVGITFIPSSMDE